MARSTNAFFFPWYGGWTFWRFFSELRGGHFVCDRRGDQPASSANLAFFL